MIDIENPRAVLDDLSARIHANLSSIVEDFVQEALLKILDNLASFRGDSKFTTWAQKIAVNFANGCEAVRIGH